jgi:hypothetical protein
MASLVLATLFFNFLFAEAHPIPPGLWLPLPLHSLFLALLVAILTALFFLGPALACHLAKRPLLNVVKESVGFVPASALRFCCVFFLIFWMARMIAPLVYLSSRLFQHHHVSSFESGVVGGIILLYLFVTGHQAIRSTAALALFTNKLSVAIFLAALIRVREGWGATVAGSEWDGWYYGVAQGVSDLAQYMAPFGLIAANFGHRIRNRKEVGLTVLFGVALPIMVTMVLVRLIATATGHSSYYQPSLTPSVGMALWSHSAYSAMGGRLFVAGVTVFGALRFAGRSLTGMASIRFPGNRQGWLIVACASIAISCLALHSYAPFFQAALDWSGCCLAATSAVLTADLVIRKHRPDAARAVDWVGLASVAFGLATPLYISHGPVALTPTPWWYPWLLPSYIVTLVVCSIGRFAQRLVVLA